MTTGNNSLTILGLPLALKAGADTERIRESAALVEERYETQVRRSGGGQSKNVLLTFMALGLADELLQLRKQLDETESRLTGLLSYMDETQ